MAVRLQIRPWGRLPDLTRPTSPPKRERGAVAWFAPYYVLAFGLAGLISTDVIPVRSWLEWLMAPSSEASVALAAAPPPHGPPRAVLGETEVRRAAMGVYTGRDDELWQVPDDQPPMALAMADPDEADGPGDMAEHTVEADAADEVAPAEPRPSRSRPARTRRKSSRARKRATPAAAPPEPAEEPRAVASRDDEPEESARPDPFEIASLDRPPRLRPEREPTPPSRPRKKRRTAPAVGGGGSCEAAIASYSEEYKMGEANDTPPDISRETYAAILNTGSYFSHCGAPGSMGIQICAAVQNGRAVGVTVRTSPRSRKVQRCVSAAVRGLSFPSHPRMDVTNTTFKPM